MGYNSLIDRSLNMAFNQAKDLALIIKLTKKVGEFNFGTSESAQIETDLYTKAIWLDSEKENTTKRKIMMKRQEIDDVNLYDTLTVSSVIWKILGPIKDDGFIAILEVEK